MNKTHKYLVEIPMQTLYRISSTATLLLFLFLIFLKDKIQSDDLTYLIITPLIWCGVTFLLLCLLAKYLHQITEVSLANKFFIAFFLLLVITSFLLPLVCYFLIKH